MNTNLPTTDMNIEDYEDKAIKRSKLAKGIGIAAAGAVGGAAIVGGTSYAATIGKEDTVLDEPLNAEEMAKGAEIGEEIEPIEEAPAQAQPTTQYVYVEKSAPASQPEPEKTTDVTWDETTNYYVDGVKVASVEEGTINGHDTMLVDSDADGHADYLAYDVNNNHRYEENEIVELTPHDNIHMGTPTAHTTNHYYDADLTYLGDGRQEQYYANETGQHQIHNNFEDEKTGEEYYGDFAENNPDYNPNADMDYGSHEQYLAENYGYDGGEYSSYHAGLNETEGEDNVASQPDLADTTEMYDDSFDSMMDSEEFLG